MKKITIPLMIAVIFCMTTTSVLAALSLKTFNPATNKKVAKLDNRYYSNNITKGEFTSKTKPSANDAKGKTILPVDDKYWNGVVRVSKTAAKSKVLKGETLGKNSEPYKRAKRYKNSDDYVSSTYIFRAKSHPKVEYSGYRIWDDRDMKYHTVKVVAELVSYSTKTDDTAHSSARNMGGPILILSNSNKKGWFNGLPSLVIGGIGTAHMRYTFYHKVNGNWTKYAIKQNVTYDDIDNMQAISIHSNDSGGFTALNAAKGDLRFGEMSNYYVTQSTALTQINNENIQKYWMSFNIDATGGTVDMLYTSPQQKVNSKHELTKTIGKPSGKWAYFTTRTYAKDVPPPEFEKPTKRVYDDKPNDDVKQDKTHNKLNKISQDFYYDINQKIPLGMVYGDKRSLTNFTFHDKVDTCVKITKEPQFYAVISGKTENVTNCFKKVTYNAGEVKYAMKTDEASQKKIYKASTVTMRVFAQIKTDEAGLTAHGHKDANSLIYDIPNVATVSYTPKGGKNKSQNTNTVKTRVQGVPKHDLSVKKVVSDSNLPIDTKKEFPFVITLNNGSTYKWEVRNNNDGTVVRSGEATFNKGYNVNLKHNEIFTILKIPQSITYTIKEKGTPWYTPSSINLVNGLVYGNSSVSTNTTSCTTNVISGQNEGTLTEGISRTVSRTITDAQNNNAIGHTFTNTHSVKTHLLKLKKKVEGEDGEFEFTLKLGGLLPNRNYSSYPSEQDYRNYMAYRETGDNYTYEENFHKTNNDGELLINVELSDEKEFVLDGLPDTATYQIIEEGAEGYKASFETVDREGDEAFPATDYTGIKSKVGAGDKGQGVKTPKESFTITGERYMREYLVTNANKKTHDLILHKKMEGGNPKDSFKYRVKFEGLQGKTIAAQFFTWDGDREPFNSITVRDLSESSYTEEFTLKSNQYVVFSNIPENAKYEVTEEDNDYIASYTGVRTDENGEKTDYEGGNDKANMDLTFGETLPKGYDTKTEYEITNTAVIEPERTSLEVEKITTDSSKGEFDFTAVFTGLEPNHEYAVFSETGDTEYTVESNGDSVYVKTGLGTLGNPYEYVNGVPVIVKRNDGKKRTIFTGGTQSENLADLSRWHKGNYTLSPAVGTVMTGEFVSFTANDSGEATVNFKGSNDKIATFSGLPVGAKYTITESASRFYPSYQITRKKVQIDNGSGEMGERLSTHSQTLTEETDKVKFVNDKRSHMLRTEKKVEGGTDQFDFTAIIKNLTKEWYMAMVPGDGNFELSMDEQGIKITASNYSDSIKDIPVKLIRPIDGAERVFYTNENGLISKDEFLGWLSKGQNGSYKFKLEWNGGYVNGSFEAEGE